MSVMDGDVPPHTLIVNFNPTSIEHILIKAIFDAFVNLTTYTIISRFIQIHAKP